MGFVGIVKWGRVVIDPPGSIWYSLCGRGDSLNRRCCMARPYGAKVPTAFPCYGRSAGRADFRLWECGSRAVRSRRPFVLGLAGVVGVGSVG